MSSHGLPCKAQEPIEELFDIIKSSQPDDKKFEKLLVSDISPELKRNHLKNPEDDTPAIFEICKTKKGYPNLLSLVMKHVDVNLVHQTMMTPLKYVILHNSEEYILILLDNDMVNVNLGVCFVEQFKSWMYYVCLAIFK